MQVQTSPLKLAQVAENSVSSSQRSFFDECRGDGRRFYDLSADLPSLPTALV